MLARLHVGVPSRRRQPLRGLVAAVWLLAVAVSLPGIPARLEELRRVSGFYTHLLVPSDAVAWTTLVIEVGLALVFFACAAVLLLRKPDSPVALFLALVVAATGAVETGLSNALIRPEQAAAIPALAAPVWGLRGLEMAGLLVLLYIFPNGRFTPSWTRWLAVPWALYIAVCALLPATPFNPLHGPTWRATPVASLLFGVGWFATGLGAQAYRLHRTRDVVERQQLKWTAVGLGLAVSGMMLFYGLLAWGQTPGWPRPFAQPTGETLYVLLRPAILAVSLAVFPVSLSVAVLQYRLFDLDLVINRALVWAALTALTMGLYILIVGSLSLLFRSSNSPLAFFLATGAVAILFQPARLRVQAAVNRLMYGERDDPYGVLARLGRRLGAALAPDAVAPAIVETIAAALKLPYVALYGLTAAGDGGQGESGGLGAAAMLMAAWGSIPAYAPERLPLFHQGRSIGELHLAPRSAGEPFSALDRRLLDDLAKQAGVALYAAEQTRQAQQLAADLQHARERLVTAREEERRRLRRDLHDGLGPVLASLTLKLDAARDELEYDSASASAMLVDIKGDIQAALADIRRLVYELRPPALDDLGLAASLRLLAERYRGANLAITCDLPERLPPLPAAVEVAVYRITAEALTNVVRHAGARTCRVRLVVSDRVELEIVDDGCGLPPEIEAGVGLVSLRERAAELGGECRITATTGAGTQVRVRLPLAGSLREREGG